MPDDRSGQQPPRNPEPGLAPIQQQVVSKSGNAEPDEKDTGTANLAKDVHWITHATFWSQVGLGIIGILALWIYNGQLTQMRTATEAATKSAKASTWAAYWTCISSQAAQNMFIQSQSSTNDSHTLAVATTQQATAEIQTEKASVWFLARIPERGELTTGPQFSLPFSVKNEGRGDAQNLTIKQTAILLREGDQLKLTDHSKESQIGLGYFPSGQMFPEKAEPPHGQLLIGDPVWDVQGKPVPIASDSVHDFLNGGSTMIAVFGVMTYSDITGPHVDRFCQVMWQMLIGTQRNAITTDNQNRCAKYNYRDVTHSYKPLGPPTYPVNIGASNISCIKPKE